jgi:histidinol-phosphate aminotransferase
MLRSFNAGVANQDSLTRMHLSESHHGFSPKVWPGLERELERLHTYPDPDCRYIRERIAEHHGLEVGMVAVGNGTDELILAAALAFLRQGTIAVGCSATFPGYAMASAVAGAVLREVPLSGYQVPLELLAARCAPEPSVAFVCNPHNPAGTSASAEALERFLRGSSQHGFLPVFDEAYSEFAGEGFQSVIPAIRSGQRALVMRTFSKAYGLAGFRIGYAIGPADLIFELLRVKSTLPFSVNRLAQAAAAISLADQAFLRHVVEENRRVKSFFYSEMERLGVPYVPSDTNFVLVQVPDSQRVHTLLHRDFGVLTRDTTPFGLGSHVRISMGTLEQTRHVCAALESLLPALRRQQGARAG